MPTVIYSVADKYQGSVTTKFSYFIKILKITRENGADKVDRNKLDSVDTIKREVVGGWGHVFLISNIISLFPKILY